MGALGILQEKSAGKDVEQSKNTSENIDFDCRIFQLKSTKIYSQRNEKKVYSFFTNIYCPMEHCIIFLKMIHNFV